MKINKVEVGGLQFEISPGKVSESPYLKKKKKRE
jgi:hypothetical protein